MREFVPAVRQPDQVNLVQLVTLKRNQAIADLNVDQSFFYFPGAFRSFIAEPNASTSSPSRSARM